MGGYPRSEKVMDVVRWNKTSQPTLDELKQILKREGLVCGLYSDSHGTKYGRHKHDFDDFVVIVSGQMKIGTDKFVWVMKPGDRLDIPANTSHWAEVVGNEDVRYLSAEK